MDVSRERSVRLCAIEHSCVLCGLGATPSRPSDGRGHTTYGLNRRSSPNVLSGPWPGHEHRVIAHRPQAPGDAADQRVVVAAGKVGAADAAGKQHVAHKGALRLGL
jgi:hypothetical protein